MDGFERDTTKHGFRLDDAMAGETRSMTTGSPVEAHRRDDRLHEPTVDGDPPIDPAARPGPVEAAGFTDEEAAVRRELAATLHERARFPCDRNGLIRALDEADGRGDLSARLRMLPVEQVFANAREVVSALAGMSTEERPGG